MRRAVVGVLAALCLAAAAPAFGTPGWITSCQHSHQLTDDPIVFPGSPGASHLHEFVGATTTDAFSTPASLRAGATTCTMPADHSAYWIPTLYRNGARVVPNATAKDALFYYRRIAAGSSAVHTIPDGLKMVIGNGHAATPAANPQLGSDIIFKCGPGSTTNLDHPPAQCSSGVMVVSIRFPNCMIAPDVLDSVDHRSHMAYPVGGRCPSSHPYVIPRLESFHRYPVGTAPIGTVTLSSGPWWTIHADFLNAWEPAGLQAFVDRCINAGINCGTDPR